jgi:xylulokinase
MAREDLVLGLDVGSGSVKGLLLGASGRVEATAARVFPTSHPAPGHVEQSPDDWFEAVVRVVRALVDPDGARSRRIRGIGVTGAAHIPVLLGTDLQVLRPAILWSDGRSVAEAVELDRTHGATIRSVTLNAPSPTWTLPQLLWLQRHEPEVMSRVRHVVLGKDEIVRRLTGRIVADSGNAASSLLFDVHDMAWSAELVAAAGLEEAVMPTVMGPSDVVGSLRPDTATVLGLPSGLPVVAGGLDSVMELVALGSTRPGEAMLRLGTAGGVMTVTGEGRPHGGMITYPFLDRGWCCQAFTSSCASALQWVRELLLPGDAQGDDGEGDGAAFAELDRLARGALPGADGITFHPYLVGERAPHWDPSLRASFIGLQARHGRAELVRAVMEGVACSLRECLDALEGLGHPVASLRATGGATRSDVWSSIVCDVLGRSFERTTAEGSAKGVAMIAATSLGLFDHLDGAVAACVGRGDELRPDHALRPVYDDLLARYREVTTALAPIYRRTTGDPPRVIEVPPVEA